MNWSDTKKIQFEKSKNGWQNEKLTLKIASYRFVEGGMGCILISMRFDKFDFQLQF